MATTKQVSVKRKRSTTTSVLKRWFREFREAERAEKAAKSSREAVRDRFLEVLAREGYEDEKGHRYLDLGEEIDGVDKVCRQKAVSQPLNAERAEDFLTKKGLWKRASKVVRVVDEAALAKLVFEGEITNEEFQALFDRKESYRFIPVRN